MPRSYGPILALALACAAPTSAMAGSCWATDARTAAKGARLLAPGTPFQVYCRRCGDQSAVGLRATTATTGPSQDAAAPPGARVLMIDGRPYDMARLFVHPRPGLPQWVNLGTSVGCAKVRDVDDLVLAPEMAGPLPPENAAADRPRAVPAAFAAESASACPADGTARPVDLMAAMRAAFPRVGGGRHCAYPWRLLAYQDAKVLLTLDGPPGQTCEACAATISATALTSGANGPQRVGATLPLSRVGQEGRPGRARAVRIGSDDGVAFETAYGHQGYEATLLELYAFRAGKAVALAPPNGRLILSADSTSAGDGHPIAVTGTWTIDPGAAPLLRVTYAIRAHGRDSRATATWRVAGDRLAPASGATPAEAIAASGN